MDKRQINTDVWIKLTPRTGVLMADIVTASVTFSRQGGSESLTLTSAGGAITLGASYMTVKIPDSSGISVAGVYQIRASFTDIDGNVRGLILVDTEYLLFY